MSLSHCLEVGYISKAHGIRGEVKIRPYSNEPDDLLHYDRLLLSREEQDAHSYTVEQCRVHGKFAMARLAGVNDRTTAEQMVGLKVWVPKSDMPELAEDEFYWYEYEGCSVVLEDGTVLGTVQSLFATGANDVLVVKGGGQEYLIPVIDQVVREYDPQAKNVVITPLPGLLEINEKR